MLQWDRLLETCFKRDATDLVFTAGHSPLIRLGRDWHTLDTPPLTAQDVKAMADQLIDRPRPGPSGDAKVTDFHYGDVQFRATAFGHPETVVLVVTRLFPGMIEYKPPEQR